MKYFVYFILFFGIILTYLLGRLALYHETQSEKPKNKLFWQKADSFWRIIFDPEVFPKDQSPLTSFPIYAFPAAQQSLCGCRGDAGVDLSHLSGIRTDRNLTPLKTKWSLSISHRERGSGTLLTKWNYFLCKKLSLVVPLLGRFPSYLPHSQHLYDRIPRSRSGVKKKEGASE